MPRIKSQRPEVSRLFSVRNRLFLGTACMLVPLLIALSISLGAFNTMLEYVDEVAHESSDELMPVVDLKASIQGILSILHGEATFAESKQELDAYIERANNRFQQLAKGSALENTAEKDVLGRAHGIWKQNVAILNNLSSLERDIDKKTFEELDTSMHAMLLELDILVSYANAEIYKVLGEAGSTRDRARLNIGLTLVFALSMALIFGHFMAQSILKPLSQLHVGADHFGKGDFKHRVVVEGRDELSRVAYAFNRMAVRLDRSLRSLRRLSTRDYLTSLLNAREFYRILDAEVERSQRYEIMFSLILVDVDHFKQVNDTYGHQGGDKVLRELAKILRSQIRNVDIPARVGGEEFAVILPNTMGEAALAIAERFRRSVEGTSLTIGHTNISQLEMTVSIGLATFPQSAKNAKDLFHQADMALYRAKQVGRNRVCIA